jgi:hypothetical protein
VSPSDPNSLAYTASFSGTTYSAGNGLKNQALLNNINIGTVTLPDFDVGLTEINANNFKEALKLSLQSAGLYHAIAGSKYRLEASMIELEPLPNKFMETTDVVICRVHYKLNNITTNKSIYNKIIATKYTMTFAEESNAVIRLIKAKESAIQANFLDLIIDIYQVPNAL